MHEIIHVAVYKINCLLQDSGFNIDDGCPLSYSSDGEEFVITFLNQVIWTTMEDERDYDERMDGFESLEQYLVKQINELIDNLATLTKLNIMSSSEKKS